jgi:hypothetical protein
MKRLLCLAAMLVASWLAVPVRAEAQDSKELVGSLTNDLGVTEAQASGGAGALFSMAKARMAPDDFGKVAAAVPGMDGLLKNAPDVGGDKKGMLGAIRAFKQLGLSPAMLTKFVPALTKFVGAKGGADVAKLLTGVLQ